MDGIERKARIDSFKRKIQEGKNSGIATVWHLDSFLAKARQRAGLGHTFK